MEKQKPEFLSTNEMRRRAPFHFFAKADNTFFVANLLSSCSQKMLEDKKQELGYGGTPGLAVSETARREYAIALELIIKANIALLIEHGLAEENVVKVRTTHDTAALWGEAKLPKIDTALRKQLVFTREVLEWSGRYAAPANDKSDIVIADQLASLDPENYGPNKEIRFRLAEYFDEDLSKKLYSIASNTFWERYSARQ